MTREQARYRPQPIDTAAVELPPALAAEVERLARSTHDVWAQARLADGWTYGAQRDDAAQRHPCLVAFDDLPESEKGYCRRTAGETLKAVLALGWRITAPEPAAAAHPPAPSSGSADLLQTLTTLIQAARAEQPESARAAAADAQIRTLWQNRAEAVWSTSRLAFVNAGKYFRGTDPLLAYEVFDVGLRHFPDDLELQYQRALMLARLGSYATALQLSTELIARIEGSAAEGGGISQISAELVTDVRALRGRLYKDRALATTGAERRSSFERAFAEYHHACQSAAPGWRSYPAINAATMALLADDRSQARALAREAAHEAEQEQLAGGPAAYWNLATRGEAALIMEDVAGAATWYREAARCAGRRYDDIATMRRNAQLIIRHKGGATDWLDEVLRIPAVIMFAGHMVDHPDAAHRRFPPQLAEVVKREIRERIAALDAGFGYTGAACGSDILFLEVMQELGHETHIMLPFAREQFLDTSVGFAAMGGWVQRFHDALQAAASVVVLSGAPSQWGGVVFEYANQLLLGSAMLKSRALGAPLAGLLVWDGREGYGPGGTASTAAEWRRMGLRMNVIPLEEIRRTEEARAVRA